MSNLKISDNEYNHLAQLYRKLGVVAEHYLLSYLECLDAINDNSIKSGAVYENLCLFKQEAKKLKNQISDMTTILSKDCLNFIDDIDQKDSYLY